MQYLGIDWSCRRALVSAGWQVQIAHARKVRDVAPLACKTDKVDARVLAELWPVQADLRHRPPSDHQA